MRSFATTLAFAYSVLFTSSIASPLQERQEAVPTVTIATGVVVGTTTQYASLTATSNKFLGIPYARSPPLRFGMPESPSSFSSPLQATKYKPACLQKFSTIPAGQLPNGMSEDCLYVNVFTPAGAKQGDDKTVMFWIYGGNLQSGDASLPMYDGSSLAAEQDVVVVTFGYRVNAFGFSSAPEIPINQQNVGFYDQRFALDWVRSNIHAFGGDPEKVTIFGQSAGGYSVKYLLRLPPRPVPFRAAILESQATVIPGNGTDSWNTLASELGCTGSSTLACVRAADGAKIENIVANKSLGFPPREDGLTFVSDVYSNFESQAANVPVMLGTNGQEASIIPFILGLNGDAVIELAQLLTSFLPVTKAVVVGILKSILPNNPVSSLVTTLFTDIVFQCDAANLAQTTHNSGRPSWRYFYNASFANTEQFPGSGAYHGAEIPEVFGTYPRTNATAQEIALSQYMQTAWANFAKNPPSGPGWLEYGAVQNVAKLGSNGNDGEETIPASQIDGFCNLLGVLGGLGSLLPAANGSSEVAGALDRMLQV